MLHVDQNARASVASEFAATVHEIERGDHKFASSLCDEFASFTAPPRYIFTNSFKPGIFMQNDRKSYIFIFFSN